MDLRVEKSDREEMRKKCGKEEINENGEKSGNEGLYEKKGSYDKVKQEERREEEKRKNEG